MTGLLKLVGGCLLLCRLVPGQGTEPGTQPKTTPEDLTEGQRIFGTQCAYCHGPKGEGGQGAVLAVPRLSHAPDDQTLFRVIREGIPGTRMPASALTTGQVWQVAAFVRTLGPRRRAQILRRSRGAASRFSQAREGVRGVTPSEATAAPLDRTSPTSALGGNAAYTAYLAGRPRPSVPLDFLQVRVVTKDGRAFTGVRVNEDAFSIQIRDLSNQFHSFWKSELTDIDERAETISHAELSEHS